MKEFLQVFAGQKCSVYDDAGKTSVICVFSEDFTADNITNVTGIFGWNEKAKKQAGNKCYKKKRGTENERF